MRSGVVFDLDGTLLDSLADIADAGNLALKEMGLPVHTIERYKQFIGNGAKLLIARALPESDRGEITVSQCLQRFLSIYRANCCNKSQPYPGVRELLGQFFSEGVPLGVVTNKPHDLAVNCVEHYFREIALEYVVGQKKGIPKKPNPAETLRLCEKMNIVPETSLFVGDSDVDMETAVRAGMRSVGVTWGFRSPRELLNAGAHKVVEQAEEIAQFLPPSSV